MIRATVAHAAAMAAVHQAAFPAAPWTAASFAVLLGQPGVFGLIDERGGVALLRVAADEAEILTIGVTTQRRGIGRTLMLAALETARAAGAAALHLEVAADNAAARGLYAALGFAAVGSRRAYYAGGADAVLLRLDLPARAGGENRPLGE